MLAERGVKKRRVAGGLPLQRLLIGSLLLALVADGYGAEPAAPAVAPRSLSTEQQALADRMQAFQALDAVYAKHATDITRFRTMRKRWLEDQLFADTMSMKVVPYEVWSLANQAPAVKFEAAALSRGRAPRGS